MLVRDFGIKYTLFKAFFSLPTVYHLFEYHLGDDQLLYLLELLRKDIYNKWASSIERKGDTSQIDVHEEII